MIGFLFTEKDILAFCELVNLKMVEVLDSITGFNTVGLAQPDACIFRIRGALYRPACS